jgi:sugar/nucleoside kinase (ribokinase family)
MALPRMGRAGRRVRRRLVFLGDLALDVVIHPDGALARGTDVPGTVRFRTGGSAANAARWAARLGARAVFVGAVGRDPWGRRLAASLAAEGVAARLSRVPGRSPRIGVVVGADGERSFVADRGVADRLAPEALRPAWFAADLLHLPAYAFLSDPLMPASLRAVELARAAGALVSVDLASRGPLLSHGRREVLRRMRRVAPDLILGNEFEAGVLAAARGPQALLDLAAVVCVKRGAEGCAIWARPDSTTRAPGPIALEVLASPVPAADTTGAGDAFDAGFLLAWLDARAAGVALTTALRRAALAGNRTAARHLLAPHREITL